MINVSPRAAVFAMVAATAALYFFGLGSFPLTDRDEGEYAATVSAMRHSGDPIIPRLNGRPYLEKPILIFWSVAGGQMLTGSAEFGARLPSALSAALLALTVGLLVRRTVGDHALALLCAAAVAFMPLSALLGRLCLTDMLLSLFTTLALGAFFLASEQRPPQGRSWYLAGWAALGLAFLTKGPVALAVVLPTAFLYALGERRFWPILKSAQIPWGVLIFVAISGPWYAMAFVRMGREFWEGFFVAQNVERFTEVLLGHGGGFLYYAPVLLVGGFPFVAAALPELAAALFRNGPALRRADPLARLRRLAALAVVITLLAFSLAATKQVNYILPAVPFVAILAGCFLWRASRNEQSGRIARAVFFAVQTVTGGILTIALAAVPWVLPRFWPAILAAIRPDSSEYALPAQPPSFIFWPLLAAFAAAISALAPALSRLHPQRRVLATTLGAAAFSASLALGLVPAVVAWLQNPSKQMAMDVRRYAPPESQVVSYGLWKPTLMYYLDREVPRFRVADTNDLAAALRAARPVVVVTRLALTNELGAVPEFLALRRYEGYLLGANAAAAQAWRR